VEFEKVRDGVFIKKVHDRFRKSPKIIQKVWFETMALSLAQLLVTETAQELDLLFEKASDKDARIQDALQKMGIKPGWGITSQILLGGNDFLETLDQITDFLVGKFAVAVFGVSGTRTTFAATNDAWKPVTLSFDNRPSWFVFMGSLSTPQTAEQAFWFKAYANYMIGMLTGAFLHFGLKAKGALDAKPGLSFVFSVKELEGMWEFTAN
jgi:hypothetical protein